MSSTQTLYTTLGVAVLAAFAAIVFSSTTTFAEQNQGKPMDISPVHRTASSTPKHATSTPLNILCVQAAVDVRETAIGTAFDTMQSAVKTALATRKTSLHDAWGMADRTARRAAVKTAWAKWTSDNRAAQTALKSGRKAAWDTFQTTVKNSCKVALPVEENLRQDGIGSTAL